ncbi:MAG: hypothetical protein OEY14_13980, partial [Myxococcales bacterium]|nr:hypothetical protein [Myxococcales bacterium]
MLSRLTAGQTRERVRHGIRTREAREEIEAEDVEETQQIEARALGHARRAIERPSAEALIESLQTDEWHYADSPMAALAARLLHQVVRYGRYGLVAQVLDQLWSFETDELSRAFLEAVSDERMRRFARAPLGSAMLTRLYDELVSGPVSAADRRASDRIALHLGGGEVLDQDQLREAERVQPRHLIFPFALPPLYRLENGAPIIAELDHGSVRVHMPSHVWGNAARYPEVEHLPEVLFLDHLRLEPNTIVGVRYYDRPIPSGEQRPPLEYHRAIDLIRLGRESETRVFDNMLEVASIAAIGLGAGLRAGRGALSLLERLDHIADAIGILVTVLRDYSSSLQGPEARAWRSFVEELDLALSLLSIGDLLVSITGLREKLSRWWQRRSAMANAPAEGLAELDAHVRQLDAALEETQGVRHGAGTSASDAPRAPSSASVTTAGEVRVAFPEGSPLVGHSLQHGPDGIKLCSDCSLVERRINHLLEFDDWSNAQRSELLLLRERIERAQRAQRRPMPGVEVPAGANPPPRITQATADAIASRIESQLLPRIGQAAEDPRIRNRLVMNPEDLQESLRTHRQATAQPAAARTNGEPLTPEAPRATVEPSQERGPSTTTEPGPTTAGPTPASGAGGGGRATVGELVEQMNRRPGTTAEFATGDAERYLRAVGAEGSHTLMEDGTSHILLRSDVATRRTALHEWVHRSLQRRAGGPRPGE